MFCLVGMSINVHSTRYYGLVIVIVPSPLDIIPTRNAIEVKSSMDAACQKRQSVFEFNKILIHLTIHTVVQILSITDIIILPLGHYYAGIQKNLTPKRTFLRSEVSKRHLSIKILAPKRCQGGGCSQSGIPIWSHDPEFIVHISAGYCEIAILISASGNKWIKTRIIIHCAMLSIITKVCAEVSSVGLWFSFCHSCHCKILRSPP